MLDVLRADRSEIRDNVIDIYLNHGSTWDRFCIESYGNANSRSTIENNTINAQSHVHGIYASYADISNNSITGSNWTGIYAGDYSTIRDNEIILGDHAKINTLTQSYKVVSKDSTKVKILINKSDE